jgi:GNAT superfamily N-acetyltransferase
MSSTNNSNQLNFIIKKLSKKSDLSNFNCGKNDELGLNEFIHKEALKYQQEGMGVTYLFYRDTKIVGYITVAMGAIKTKETDLQIDNYEKATYPALFLGRLAVDNTEREKGIGTYLIDYCIDFALKSKKRLGCRFIVLVTKGERRIKFYEKNDFKGLQIPLKNSLKMMCFQLS